MAKIKQGGAVIKTENITATNLDELRQTDIFSHLPEAKQQAEYEKLWEKISAKQDGTEETGTDGGADADTSKGKGKSKPSQS